MQFTGVYAKTVRKVSLSKLGDGQIIILKIFRVEWEISGLCCFNYFMNVQLKKGSVKKICLLYGDILPPLHDFRENSVTFIMHQT